MADYPGFYLKMTDLQATRGDRALFFCPRWSVSAGELWQVLGTNGIGKSTLLRIIAGLYHGYDGQISWTGQCIPAQNDIFYLGHQLALKPILTVREELCYGYQPCDTQQCEQVADQWGLSAQLDQRIATLSAGQKQRLALARLSCTQAPLWLLDEPFAALDQSARHFVETQLKQHVTAGGTVICTHHGDWLQPPSQLQILTLVTEQQQVVCR